MSIEDVIKASLNAATSEATGEEVEASTESSDTETEETSSDTSADTETGDSTATASSESSAQPVDDDAKLELTTPATDADTAKELEAFGLKPPIAGQRENRLPYSRMVKIFGNAKKKIVETYTKQLAAKDEQYKPLLQTKEVFDKVNHLIANDPDRYLGYLAALHPAYKKFIGGESATKPAETKPADPLAELPAPDAQYADGSVGYSPEGFKKALQWAVEQGENRGYTKAEQLLTKRFGPVEKEWRDTKTHQELDKRVRKTIYDVTQAWGNDTDGKTPLVNKYAREIDLAMKADRSLSLAQAASYVLLPKVRESFTPERTKMRAELLKEINERPRAASRTTSSTTTTSTPATQGEQTVEDLVRNSLRKNKLLSAS